MRTCVAILALTFSNLLSAETLLVCSGTYTVTKNKKSDVHNYSTGQKDSVIKTSVKTKNFAHLIRWDESTQAIYLKGYKQLDEKKLDEDGWFRPDDVTVTETNIEFEVPLSRSLNPIKVWTRGLNLRKSNTAVIDRYAGTWKIGDLFSNCEVRANEKKF